MFKNKQSSSNLLILFGVILIVGGLLGSFLIINNNPVGIEHGRYRFIEKQTKTAFSPTVFSPMNSTEPTETLSATIEINAPQTTPEPYRFVSIVPGTTFIHSEGNPKLEHPNIPTRIEIPAIGLIAPVVIPDFNTTKVEGETFGQWVAPSQFAAGWHPNSALLGEVGNTVINGHHNEFGEVFGNLVKIVVGDEIKVYHDNIEYKFVVSNVMILPERFQPVEVRTANARWLAKSDDIRLTLVTCWPKESNTHRLIIVARPLFSN